MDFIAAIKSISKKIETIGFKLDDIEDLGMHKYAAFSNETYSFNYSYDRGGIELILQPSEGIRLDIVRLVNWLNPKGIKIEYLSLGQTTEKEKIDYYGEILFSNFELIDTFICNANNKDFQDFEKYVAFEGARYWNKIFTEKGKSIPESLKKILKDDK